MSSISLNDIESARRIADSQINKLMQQIISPNNNKYSTVWIQDVDTNSDEVIGLEIIKDILFITIAKYTETGNDRNYRTISQFAVDREVFRSALDYLDVIED